MQRGLSEEVEWTLRSPSRVSDVSSSCGRGELAPEDITGSLSLTTQPRLQSPLRILSDAPKFRAECLQTLRDGEVEEESAAPPSIYAPIATPLLHDFIVYLTAGSSGRVRKRPLGLWSARRGVALQDSKAAAENGNRDTGQGLPLWLK
ncbi:unnamed protein product [Menidia menidia]|uniref:(Atlantic silverside) hypothetical protein n=1 Tax=Menidia menidia TaxID=238744 RepID=A0A8S4BQH4_9TELE|nr:unnamed protein product [Menidia menidia]